MTGEQQYGKRANKRRPSQEANRFVGESEFINLELSADQQASYRAWRLDVESVFDIWDEILEGGYRVSTKWDDYGSCHACFVIPGEGSENSGYILTGRGGSAYRAISEALYKHSEILRGAWSAYTRSTSAERDSEF